MSPINPWDDDQDKSPWDKNSQRSDLKKIVKSILDFFKKNFFYFDQKNNSNEDGGKTYKNLSQIVIFVFFALYAISGFCQVEHDERGVILRFGKWSRTVGPGLQYVLPYPFESIILQKVTTINKIEIGSDKEESLVLTGDSNLANVGFSVLWKIKADGVEDFLFNARNPRKTVEAVSESVIREIIGQKDFAFIQTDGRSEVQKTAQENLQIILDEYKLGIEVLRVDLQRVEPPSSVIDSFRDVERAQADQQSERNKAEAYDRDTRARTRGLVAEKLNCAEAKKCSLIEEAKGTASRFLAVYQQYKLSPDIISKMMYIQTMRDIYSSVNKIVLDKNIKSLPHIPLQQMHLQDARQFDLQEK